jgi:hypothetical protein
MEKIRVRDNHHGSYFREQFWVTTLHSLSTSVADPDPGWGAFFNLDPELKNLAPGFGIRNKHPGLLCLCVSSGKKNSD